MLKDTALVHLKRRFGVQLGKGNILVVDDEQDICEMLSMVLERCGFQVHTARSAEIALQILDQHSFDLVISDIRMQAMDGIELIRQIRQRHPTLPRLIFMSGHQGLTQNDLNELGVNGFIRKPFELSDLTEYVERIVALPIDDVPRQWRRYKVGGASRIEHTDNVTPNPAELINISQGGMCVSVGTSAVSVGDKIRVRVQVNDPVTVSLFAEAVVRWVKPALPGEQPGVGVQFVRLEPESEAELQRLLTSLDASQQ